MAYKVIYKIDANLVVIRSYQKYKTDLKVVSRRGLNNLSSSILDELFQLYPNAISSKKLSKNLDLREQSVTTAIKNIISYGLPIEIIHGNNNDKLFRADPSEPISWIFKEKESAEVMLNLLRSSSNDNDISNKKKSINSRIYEEYVQNLNDLFDKWTSLRLFDQLKNSAKDD